MTASRRLVLIVAVAAAIVSVAAVAYVALRDDVYSEVREVVVGPELKDCVGVGPMKCMVVDGLLFYDGIDGFDYQEGYEYRLRIEQFDAWPGQEPPQDAGRYGYRLIEIISKNPVE